MPQHSPGLDVEVVWCDSDVVDVRVRGATESFYAEVRLYVGHDEFQDLANRFRGFPRDPSDERRFESGSWDSEFAGGGVRLRLSTVDGLGHCVLHFEARLDPRLRTSTGHPVEEGASFAIPVEPAGVDQFVADLSGFVPRVGDVARLAGAI